jgi:hypothetical protein
MPSIHDPHTHGFNENTDWYSWGIVTFLLWAGIHPYKGGLDGYKPGEFVRRMKDNASVFSPGIRLNHAVRDIQAIPRGLLDWYEQVFQKGVRCPPPDDFGRVILGMVTAAKVVNTQGTLFFKELLKDIKDPIVRIYGNGYVQGKWCHHYKYQDKNPAYKYPITTSKGNVGTVSFDSGIHGYFKSMLNKLESRSKEPFVANDRVFEITSQGITETMIIEAGDRGILTRGTSWNLLVQATQFFDGIAITDMMDHMYIVVPGTKEQDTVCTIKCPVLKGLKPITAKACRSFATIIAQDKNGYLKKIELALNLNQGTIVSSWVGDTDTSDINFTVTPNGIVATIVEDGELALFHYLDGAKVSKFKDPRITTDTVLGYIDGVGMVGYKDGVLNHISTSKI